MTDPNADRDAMLSRMGAAMIHVPAPKFGPLSFADAKAGGEAMYDQWAQVSKDLGTPAPPYDRSDFAWSDLFRAGFDALRWGK